MYDTLILYWQPGSGGDAIHQILNLDPGFATVVDHFSLTDDGRWHPQIDRWFMSNFDHPAGEWFSRQWTTQDLDKLQSRRPSSVYKTLVIPTHRRDQAQWLKSHIPNSQVLGICYPEELYFSVLQNWVRKVGARDKKIIEIYQDRGWAAWGPIFGLRLFKDQLQFGSSIAKYAANEWDINIEYGNLVIGHLESLQCLEIDQHYVTQVLSSWLPRQKKFYQCQWSISDNLRSALGTNQLAQAVGDPDLCLDLYDKILLQHWCRNHTMLGSFQDWNTVEQADAFLGNTSYLGK